MSQTDQIELTEYEFETFGVQSHLTSAQQLEKWLAQAKEILRYRGINGKPESVWVDHSCGKPYTYYLVFTK